MKSYDDLQRFKEKTQTKHIEFKDMSEQTRNADNTNWAIIRQLTGAESDLGNGQRIDVAAPQPAAADFFSQPVTEVAPVKSLAKASAPVSSSVAAFVAAKPAAQGGSLLDSISASLKPAAQPQTSAQAPLSAAVPDMLRSSPDTSGASPLETSLKPTTPSGASLLDAVRAQAAPAQLAHLQSGPVSAAELPSAAADRPHLSSADEQPARFKQLFSAAGARAAAEQALPKDTPLQPLLERIASCR